MPWPCRVFGPAAGGGRLRGSGCGLAAIAVSPVMAPRYRLPFLAKRHPDLADSYQAIAGRRGTKIATTAIARKLLTRAYHLLTDASSAGAPS